MTADKLKTLVIEGFKLAKREGEPTIRDLELGEELGYARRIKVREFIKQLIKEGDLEDVKFIPRVGMTSQGAARKSKEYWLTREQAIIVCMLSKAPNARLARRVIARVFDLYLAGELPAQLAAEARYNEWIVQNVAVKANLLERG